LPNERLAGARLTAGTTPVPLRLAVCGLEAPLSVMDTIPERAPAAVGVKVTLIVQMPDTANVAGLTGQLLVCAKSPALAPVIPMLEIVSRPGPLFVTVIGVAALVVVRL